MQIIVLYQGAKVKLDCVEGDHISKILGFGAFYEQDLLLAIRNLGVTGVYVDIGANIGNHSVFFARFCKSTSVIAVEPNPAVFPHLQSNAEREGAGKIKCFRIAIHNKWQFVDMEERSRTNIGMARITHGTKIPAMALDELVKGYKIALVKIDVEGLEPQVLMSAESTIKRSRPVLVIESATQDAIGKVNDFLEPLGYRRSAKYASTPTYIWSAVSAPP